MKKVLICSLGIVSLMSCKKDKTPVPTCTTEISYLSDIKPVVDLNCATSGCHDAAATGIAPLVNHSHISTNAEAILSVINHESGFTPMPMGGTKLPDSTIQKFNCWIDQGKKNN